MPRERIDVDALLAERGQAQATVDAATAAIEQHHAEQAAERERRELEYDRGLVAEYDDRNRQLLADEQVARKAFEAALLDTAVIDAWVTMRAARWARVTLNAEAQSAASRIDAGTRIAQLEPRDPRLIEDVVRIAEDAARRRGIDRTHTEVVEPREQYVEGEQS